MFLLETPLFMLKLFLERWLVKVVVRWNSFKKNYKAEKRDREKCMYIHVFFRGYHLKTVVYQKIDKKDAQSVGKNIF